MERSRNWCFTINNYTEQNVWELNDIECRYMVYQYEQSQTGTPHIQGFIVFQNARRLTTVRSMRAFRRAHLEVAHGSVEANVAYCTKQTTRCAGTEPIERGNKPKSQAEKGDMEEQRWNLIRENAKIGNFDDIPSDVYIRNYGALRSIHKDHMVKPPDANGVTGVWISGKSGVGKSRYARYHWPNAYLKMCNKWWDGYQNESNVIIDDIDINHKVLGHHLKIWADRYSHLAESKGSAMHIRPQHLVVTSQYTIEEIWSEEPATVEALNRRFQKVHLTEGDIRLQFVEHQQLNQDEDMDNFSIGSLSTFDF